MLKAVTTTPLPRRSSSLAPILRGLLVATVALALLVTLATYTGSERLSAPLSPALPSLPSRSYQEDPLGFRIGRASQSWNPGLVSLGTGEPGQTKQASALPQSLEGRDYDKEVSSSLPDGRWGVSDQGGGKRATPPKESLSRGDPKGREASVSLAPKPLPPAPASPPSPISIQVSAQAVALSDLESQMWEAVNNERVKVGLPPIAIDQRLVLLARERSNDMASRDYFSHTTPEGKMIFDFLDAGDIYSPYAGENLARTNAGADQAVQLAVSGFMNSGSHRRNMLNSHYTYLGIGEATASDGMRYFTLVFIGT